MQPTWDILQAMLHCHYKAWQLAQSHDESSNIHLHVPLSVEKPVVLPVTVLTANDKIVLTALYQNHLPTGNQPSKSLKITYSGKEPDAQVTSVRIRMDSKKAQKLFTDALDVITIREPPAFYRNPHCPFCSYWDTCYKKLKERDCISLLSGMSPRVIQKFHKKGIYSIVQLSHLFHPRRRRRHPQVSTNYLWELKALAITEQKTFVLYPPDVKESPVSIYLDFEGIPDEGWIYLIGVIIKENGLQDKSYSYWANAKENEEEIFASFFSLLRQYPQVPIYHYGSYETKGIKQILTKWPQLKTSAVSVESNMVNLLSFLRTHVYPPIYSNGLKELTRFLGFKWSVEGTDGLLSIDWRKSWELDKDEKLKENLIQYNLDDCKALIVVQHWFLHLAANKEDTDIKQVSEMKKQSMYKLQNNPQLGEDFQFISKAAYFDYQRSKVYLKNKNTISKAATTGQKPKSGKKGIMVWKPKKVNEVIILLPKSACPRCGSTNVYQSKRKILLIQTDLKFTPTGVRQHVVEYQASYAKCSNCSLRYNNHNFHRLQYGSNVFAYVTNLYVGYNLSNYMISRIMQEQFGIWISPMYLVMRKEKWCMMVPKNWTGS